MLSLPSIPPDLLSDWIQPAVIVALVGLLLTAFRGVRTELKEEIRASETRQAKRTDELKADINRQMSEFKAEVNK